MARSPLAGRDGFTLLEVLIAFAILSVAIVSLIQLTSQGLRLLKVSASRRRRRVHSDAVLKLESAGIDYRIEERLNLPGDCNFVLKHS